MFSGIFAFVLTAAFIGAIVMLSWRSIPTSNEQLLTYMLGQLSGFVAAAVGVYFSRRAGAAPSGTPEDPVQTEVVNPPEKPANVTDAGDKHE